MSELMETILIIVVPISLVILGMVIMPYLERKELIKTKNVEMTKQMVELINAIIYKNVKNEDVKNKASKIYDAIVDSIEYAERIIATTDIETKKQLVYENAIKKLEILDVKLDKNDMEIVRIITEKLVEMVEKDAV